MRLTEREITAIKETAAKWFGADAEVRLFGSRAKADTAGGDIDLHVMTDPAKNLVCIKTEIVFILELQDRIGEQKIDVIARSRGAPIRAIDAVATRTGVLL